MMGIIKTFFLCLFFGSEIVATNVLEKSSDGHRGSGGTNAKANPRPMQRTWEAERSKRPPVALDRTHGCIEGELWKYIDELINEVGSEVYSELKQYGALDAPMLYRMLIDTDATDEYYGVEGEYTQLANKMQRKLQRFWTQTNELQPDLMSLKGMHGIDLADNQKMVSVYTRIFNLPLKHAQTYIDHVQDIIEKDDIGYDNPLFTLASFITDTSNTQIFLPDGLFAYSRAFSDVVKVQSEVIHARGFAHKLGKLVNATHHPETYGSTWRKHKPGRITYEESRRAEMMADAFSLYYLAHCRGGMLNDEEIRNAARFLGSLGDCDFDQTRTSHRGTPAQRECAALWGASLADTSAPYPLEPSELVSHFDQALVHIINLDSSVCPKKKWSKGKQSRRRKSCKASKHDRTRSKTYKKNREP